MPIPGFPIVLRCSLTLLLGWLAARLCVALGTPIPWMIGPLLATRAGQHGRFADLQRQRAAQRRAVGHRRRAGAVLHPAGDGAGAEPVVAVLLLAEPLFTAGRAGRLRIES